MTVSSTANRNSYTGNGTLSNYDYSFRISLDQDLLVVVRNTTTDVETDLVLNTDYTVNDAGEDSGGSIDLVDASQAWLSSGNLATGYIMIIRRVVALTQETDIRNQGDFYPEVHEDAFDKFTYIAQQQQDAIDRTVSLPNTVTSADFDPTIPAALVGENSLALVSNAAGNGFSVGPSVASIEGAAASAAAAAASASAASISETNAAASAVATAADAVSTAADVVTIQNLIADMSSKESIIDNVSNQDLTITIDETVNYCMVVEYVCTRGSNVEYGRLLVHDNSPFELSYLERVGTAGITFNVNESGGVGTLRYTSDASSAGTIRYKVIKFGV